MVRRSSAIYLKMLLESSKDVDKTKFDVDAYPGCCIQGLSGIDNTFTITEDLDITKLNTAIHALLQEPANACETSAVDDCIRNEEVVAVAVLRDHAQNDGSVLLMLGMCIIQTEQPDVFTNALDRYTDGDERSEEPVLVVQVDANMRS